MNNIAPPSLTILYAGSTT